MPRFNTVTGLGLTQSLYRVGSVCCITSVSKEVERPIKGTPPKLLLLTDTKDLRSRL